MTSRRWAVLAVVALVAAGCSSGTEEAAPTTPATTTTTTTTTPTAAETTAPDLAITIAGGEVTPMDQRLEGTVGTEIVLTVDSDAVDEVHVHSVPEHSFPVAVGAGQEFRFTVDVPGSVDIELHDANVTVATVLVRP